MDHHKQGEAGFSMAKGKRGTYRVWDWANGPRVYVYPMARAGAAKAFIKCAWANRLFGGARLTGAYPDYHIN